MSLPILLELELWPKMSRLDQLSLEIMRLITDGLTPCNVAVLMMTTPSMQTKMLKGGVRKLMFDSLHMGRLVSFNAPTDACNMGTCHCMLQWLHKFTHLREVVMNERQFNQCLGAKVAPFPYGLPSCLTTLTIVFRKAFLRWINKDLRQDYKLATATPNLKTLRLAESPMLAEAVDSEIVIDKTQAGPQWGSFLQNLPVGLETLLTPPMLLIIKPFLLPPTLTRSSIALNWRESFDATSLPTHLTSLSVYFRDRNVLDKFADRMFPKSLTEMRIRVRAPETGDEDYEPTWLTKLPQLGALTLTNVDNVRLADLPEVLTSLALIYYWPSKGNFNTKGWTPEYLTKFTVQRYPPLEDISALPKTITNFKMLTDRENTIMRMPENVTKLRIPARTVFAAPQWPSHLHTLNVHPLTKVDSDWLITLPKSLTKFSFSVPESLDSNAKIDAFFRDVPATITHLVLWNRKLDLHVFKSLKPLPLQALEIYAGDTKKDQASLEVARFKWTDLSDLPPSLTLLRLPVGTSTKPEVFDSLPLPKLLDLYIPLSSVGFTALQLTLLNSPHLRNILAHSYVIDSTEIDSANSVLSAHPLLTLRSIDQPNLNVAP